MLKFKVTDKQLAGAAFVFTAGYCELQELLRCEEPLAYASGRMGWRYDLYRIANVFITTGYDRPRGCGIPFPAEIKEEYTERLKNARIDKGVYYICLMEFVNALRAWAVNHGYGPFKSKGGC